MYTRCPECQTLFRITAVQLEARAGLVRCGRCRAVFQAGQFLLATLPDAPAAAASAEPVRTHTPHAAAGSPPRQAAAPGGAAARQDRRVPAAVEDAGIPTVSEQEPSLVPHTPARTRTVFWLLGNVLLLAVLVAQVGYFYRDELARYPELRPALEVLCRTIACRIETPRDASRIELLEATRVEPHPHYENALRIRVSMVNRAPFAQPYPWLELSLTDRAGNLIARRRFAPAEYLGRAPAPEEMLPVDVVKNATFGVTDPDGKSAGYEIRLVHP